MEETGPLERLTRQELRRVLVVLVVGAFGLMATGAMVALPVRSPEWWTMLAAGFGSSLGIMLWGWIAPGPRVYLARRKEAA